jgi:hypothetical protein
MYASTCCPWTTARYRGTMSDLHQAARSAEESKCRRCSRVGVTAAPLSAQLQVQPPDLARAKGKSSRRTLSALRRTLAGSDAAEDVARQDPGVRSDQHDRLNPHTAGICPQPQRVPPVCAWAAASSTTQRACVPSAVRLPPPPGIARPPSSPRGIRRVR